MNIGINLDHQLGTSQQLNLAPQLLQWLRLLQLPTLELASLVQTELEKNPALEVGSEADEDHESTPEDVADVANPEPEVIESIPADNQDNHEKERNDLLAELNDQWNNDSLPSAQNQRCQDSDYEEKQRFVMDSITATTSLQEHLMKQLPSGKMTDQEIQAAEIIIGSIDDNGYLTLSVEEIASCINMPATSIEHILSTIQTFDPAGIAARDLKECLLLQIHDKDSYSSARMIITDHLEALGRKQYTEIARTLNLEVEDVIRVQELIVSLNPAPGEKFTQSSPEYINADVIVHEMEGKYVTELNESYIPRLRISASCRQLIDKPGLKADEISYLRNKIRSASFLIQGIRQRQATLQKVSDQIATFQQEYLSNPKGELKPLTMAKVAAIIGVHETTVSRAISNKYIRTPRGLFEMKHFFRAGYRCANGSALTPEVVKDMIAGLIEKENPVSPLKDITIARILDKKSGLRLARRTIAKYREEMNIPSSKERRQAMLSSTRKTAEIKKLTKPALTFVPDQVQSAVA